MKSTRKFAKKTVSCLLTAALLLPSALALPVSAAENSEPGISYNFSGENSADPGYAQGTVTLTADSDGSYSLYWSDDEKALEGYYAIDELTTENGSASFEFGDHAAIPAGATKVIAVADGGEATVENAAAVYSLPESKQLAYGSGGLLYTFNSYSDVHIDCEKNGAPGYYANAEKNWAQALQFAVNKDTDFIVSSGDMVTNAAGPDNEWLAYERILADSDYLNPVWESDGNHDMRCGVSSGLKSYVRASGTDSTIANYDANKPYYYVKEQSTGDVFIFMALESDSNPSSCDEFSEEQMSWLVNLLETYYGTGVNIYIIEHSPIKGFGAGDRMEKPYYKAHLSEKFYSTVQFKSLLQKYPKLIWMSGHTHEDYSMGYNYSNENGTACHMIHNPAVAGSTWAAPEDSSLDYNNGIGYNSQGYYVEVYENQVVYYGANLTDELIYPEYCYIMDGSRNTTAEDVNETGEITTVEMTDVTGDTGATLPEGIETQRFYFANTNKWQYVDCYSWSDDDTKTNAWPGYAALYCGTTEEGVDLYYCDVPASHTWIIWNNTGQGYQTEDIKLDGVNNFFAPATSENFKKMPYTASVFDYNIEPTTEPPATPDEPTTTEPPTTEPPVDKLMGDVNVDGEVNILDAAAIQLYMAKLLANAEDYDFSVADYNLDGEVNILDAARIQLVCAKLAEPPATPDEAAAERSEESVKAEPALANAKAEESAELSVFADSSTDKASTEDEAAPVSLADTLAGARDALDKYYTFASYDQYQSLKKLYYAYRNDAEASGAVVEEFARLEAELSEIAEHILECESVPEITVFRLYMAPLQSRIDEGCVFYANIKDSSGTYHKYTMEKTDLTYNGTAVYMVEIDTPEYSDVIKIQYQTYDSTGENWIGQVVDEQSVPLSNYNGKIAVCTTESEGSIEPFTVYTLYMAPEQSLIDDGDRFKANIKDSSGTYHPYFMDKTDLTYNGAAVYSVKLVNPEYTDVIKIQYQTYDSTGENWIGQVVDEQNVPLSYYDGKIMVCTGASEGALEEFTADTVYNLYMAPEQSLIDDGDRFKANIKDSSGTYHPYFMDKTDLTYNGAAVYSVKLVNPEYTDVIKIQYQTYDSTGENWIGQVVDEQNVPLSYYDGKIMVCTAASEGTLEEFAAD